MKFQSVSREEWTGQKYDVTTWEDELQFLMWTLQALKGISFVLIMILIAIMVTGIMNTLWIAIRERTREIGALRAIGMQRTAVARLFLLEASCLGFLGGGLGVILGTLVASLVNAAHVKVPKAAHGLVAHPRADHVRPARRRLGASSARSHRLRPREKT